MSALTFGPTSVAHTMLTTRRFLGLSVREMTTRVGVSHGTVSDWERGAGEPSFSQLAE